MDLTSFSLKAVAISVGCIVALVFYIRYRARQNQGENSEKDTEKKEKVPVQAKSTEKESLVEMAKAIENAFEKFKSVEDASTFVEKKTGASVTFKKMPTPTNLLYVLLHVSRKVKVRESPSEPPVEEVAPSVEEETRKKVTSTKQRESEKKEDDKIMFKKKKVEKCESGECKNIEEVD